MSDIEYPLDYSIEFFGSDIAWAIFTERLRDIGVSILSLPEVTYWRVKAMFANGDTRSYMTALKDAGVVDDRRIQMYLARMSEAEVKPLVGQSYVYKWVPGDHFHVENERFDTLEEAQGYLAAKGIKFLGVQERFVYAREGD